MKKFIVTLIAFCCLLIFGSSHANAEETYTKEIFSIPEPTWIFNAGMNKGKYHDRQDLGFILRENTVLKVRQVNPNFKGKLTVRLLGNDSKTEKSVAVGTEWIQISGTEALVPFVDTPYGSTAAKLEYKIADSRSQKPLPIYEYHTNETKFFESWDQYDGKNRYFLKADIHGAGGAYYGANWTANSSNTTDMWLKKVDWGTLHEIAHGYQAGFDGKGMYTGEVSNNLFGVQYQYEKYGKQADKIGWLFNYGKKETVENNLYNKLITNHGTYASVDLREKLILLTMLKQKAGNESFTKMYQEYRKLANQPNFNKNDYSLPDLMNKYYSENSQQDFTPVLKKWGLSLDENQAEKNRFAGYPAVASLADVVPASGLTRAHNLLDNTILITSNFEMVQNKDIAPLNLKGNLNIQLKTENIQELIGMRVSLKDGNKEVASTTISGKEISFKGVPNGIYRLTFSGEKMPEYTADKAYIYVKEAQNDPIITLKKIKVSKLANQSIQFLGLGDSEFGKIKTNLNDQEAIFSITKKEPHSYFNGELYAKVTVKDHSGNIKYEKTVEGTNAAIGADKIALQEGDTIDIYHAESKNRLRSAENIIDRTKKTNQLVMTKFGLKNLSLQNDPEQDLIKKIDRQGSDLLKEEENNTRPLEESNVKKQLLAAIKLLNEPYQTQYMDKFHSLFN